MAEISSYIGDTIIASSNSASEALSQTISAYTDGYCLGKTSEIVFEDDYTYVVKAGWEDSGARSYSANVMSFKDACAHYERYVGGEFALTIKDEGKIKRYIDLIEASGVASMGGHKFLCSEVSPVDDAYIYENWQFKAIYGDWGLQDELMIVSRRYSIADGGTVTFEGETTIKQMFVNRLGD